MSWIKTWRIWHGIKYQTLYFDLLTTSITAESCSENENDGRTSPSFTFIHNTFVISLLSVHWVRDKKDETISSRGKGIDLISAAKFCLIFHEKRCASLNLQCQAKYDCVNLTPPLSSSSPPYLTKAFDHVDRENTPHSMVSLFIHRIRRRFNISLSI